MLRLLLVISLGWVFACHSAPSTSAIIDNNPPLADADALLASEPDPATLPRLRIALSHLDARHTDLFDVMSPVKSQSKRGVCSIFSTLGLMEHLYIKEGTIETPDFSEQYLQWSAKFEIGSFPNSSGSNAYYNLGAIRSFGVVAEAAWPYETTPWDAEDDSECDGEDDQPTRCYTNGHPSADVKASRKYFLSGHKALHPLDIKSHIASKGTAVISGFTVYYQAWNHRLSDLPLNSQAWANGVVVYPNDTDMEKSLEKRAGHSILLIGWDDDLEFPMRDEEGESMVDEDGNPVVDRGFYLFKNSWGTESFGVDHELAPGYGWISQRYMHEHGRIRISYEPAAFSAPVESCDDGFDNDFNGNSDCADTACTTAAACSVE